jgi:hypothetical protein
MWPFHGKGYVLSSSHPSGRERKEREGKKNRERERDKKKAKSTHNGVYFYEMGLIDDVTYSANTFVADLKHFLLQHHNDV